MHCPCDKHFDRKKLDEKLFSSAIAMAEITCNAYTDS